MGYCLIPSNKAQKLLLILGKGGEGKSRVGLIMRGILGTNMNSSSRLVLEIAIHCLVIYQTYVLWIKRQNAIDIS